MRKKTNMGPLERATYRRYWRASQRFRRNLANSEASSTVVAPIDVDLKESKSKGEWLSLREVTERIIPSRPREQNSTDIEIASPPHLIAAALLFSRVFDGRPELLRAIYSDAPTILIDIADHQMLEQVKQVWQSILFGEDACPIMAGETRASRTSSVVAYLIVEEIPNVALREKQEKGALNAVCLVRPIIAMSPLSQSHLPKILLQAATETIQFPTVDLQTIMHVIKIVTGRPCRELITTEMAQHVSLTDLAVAVRSDRSPTECVSAIRRLVKAKDEMRAARDLTLSNLHGLGEARAWAQSAIADIKAWKEGRISWSQISSGIALSGPPGCGKTTFATVFCQEAGLHMVAATLAKWQSSGEAHLGHLLRAMRHDFEEARANAPSCVFIDEIDSFPERAKVNHRWRDYVVEVVNALLSEIDGIKGREGVLVIGASNDIGRCEPALLRAGRLETTVTFGLPDVGDLERMFRVRLRNELVGVDLSTLAEMAVGMTGADVEQVVKGARRAARQDGGRGLAIGDLHKAMKIREDLPIEERWKFCVHEAAHLLAEVIHFGPDDVFANAMPVGARGGMTLRGRARPFAGTLDSYRKLLQVQLAGRAGEELLLGAPSHAGGGARGSDLDNATSLAAAIVGSLGLTGDDFITYVGARDDTKALLSFSEVRQAVAAELASAARATRSLLEAQRPALDVIARKLLERGRVSGEQVASILFETHDARLVTTPSHVTRHADYP